MTRSAAAASSASSRRRRERRARPPSAAGEELVVKQTHHVGHGHDRGALERVRVVLVGRQGGDAMTHGTVGVAVEEVVEAQVEDAQSRERRVVGAPEHVAVLPARGGHHLGHGRECPSTDGGGRRRGGSRGGFVRGGRRGRANRFVVVVVVAEPGRERREDGVVLRRGGDADAGVGPGGLARGDVEDDVRDGEEASVRDARGVVDDGRGEDASGGEFAQRLADGFVVLDHEDVLRGERRGGRARGVSGRAAGVGGVSDAGAGVRSGRRGELVDVGPGSFGRRLLLLGRGLAAESLALEELADGDAREDVAKARG